MTTRLPAKPIHTANDPAGPAPGLFVIWETGREFQQVILEDLSQRFQVTSVYEIEWQPDLVWANFQRFYSDLQVRGVYHESNKGRGPFLAITLLDRHPQSACRETGRGSRMVNSNFFDAKNQYRELTGGLGVHCGETDAETHRDIAMLLGSDRLPQPDSLLWDGEIERLDRDITGAHGWTSLEQIFNVLSPRVPFVAIDYGLLLSSGEPQGTRPLDILTSDYFATYTILSSGPIVPVPPRSGNQRTIRIAGQPWSVGIRFPGDGYLHPEWASRLLETRQIDTAGIPRPAQQEGLWLVMHFYATQARSIPDQVRKFIDEVGRQQGAKNLPKSAEDDTDYRSALLCSLRDGLAATALSDDSHAGQRPHLESTDNLLSDKPSVLRQRRVLGAFQRLRSWIETRYYLVRDKLVHRFPSIRRFRLLLSNKKLRGQPQI